MAATRGPIRGAQDIKTHTGRVTAAVADVLQPLCNELQANAPCDEHEVMNLACLVPRSGQQAFENGVFEAAASFDNNYTFDYNGPWPPYNFVNGGIRL